MKTPFLLGVVLILVGTNLFTFHATREATIEDLEQRFRAGHKTILRDEGFEEHEQVTLSGVEFERRLKQIEIRATGISSARWNNTLGSFYFVFMLTITGVLVPFVRWQKRVSA